MTTPHGLGYVKMVIMVDEDVDPFNLPQVMWALSAKVNPADEISDVEITIAVMVISTLCAKFRMLIPYHSSLAPSVAKTAIL